MAERIYPSAKPASTNPGQTLNGTAFPAPKSQLYNAARPTYRPTPPKRRRRSCCNRCCLFCIWFTIAILALILLAAIAGGVVWVLYRPQRPNFSVSNLKITTFNFTTTTGDSPTSRLNSRMALSVSARNPNKKIIFFYDPITIDVSSSGADLGNGSFPAFVHGTKNVTSLRASISTGGPSDLDPDSATSLRSGLKKKNTLPLEIRLATKVKVKMGSWTTKKVGIRVFCNGIDAPIPKGNSSTAAGSSDVKCDVKLRMKIWKFQF